MSFDYSTLIRPDILVQSLEQWTNSLEAASKRLGIPKERLAKLSSNENLYGPSPKVREAIASFSELHYYPDPLYVNLRDALSQHTGAPADRIIVGNGLDEVIDLLNRVLLMPGDAILDCPPSFEVYEMQAKTAHAHTVAVPRRAEPATGLHPRPAGTQTGFALDLDGIERACAANDNIKMLWLTSPNNPDGALLPQADLERLLKLPTFVIVDEAYVDFAPYSFVSWTDQYENLAVLRTFSKGPALAGMRIGYGVFPKVLADNIWKIAPPFNVNTLGVVAAMAALADWDYTREIAGKIIEAREKLFEELHQFAFLQPYRSHGSFILCKVVGRSAADVRNDLAKQGVLIRLIDNGYAPNHIRISIGTPREMKMVVAALQSVASRM